MTFQDADICVVGGAGHVGLPLSIVFAAHEQRVRIYDVNPTALEVIAGGTMPFMERGAEPLLAQALASGRLELTADPAGVAGARAVILTIGTPIDEFLNPTAARATGRPKGTAGDRPHTV